MERLERWEKFKAFLQKKGVLDKYMEATSLALPKKIYEYDDVEPCDWVRGAFIWKDHGKTKLWAPISIEWEKICYDE